MGIEPMHGRFADDRVSTSPQHHLFFYLNFAKNFYAESKFIFTIFLIFLSASFPL